MTAATIATTTPVLRIHPASVIACYTASYLHKIDWLVTRLIIQSTTLLIPGLLLDEPTIVE
jgi:hypothetical protein